MIEAPSSRVYNPAAATARPSNECEYCTVWICVCGWEEGMILAPQNKTYQKTTLDDTCCALLLLGSMLAAATRTSHHIQYVWHIAMLSASTR
jgi:hypothetical protein